MTTIELSGQNLGPAWLAVMQASSDIESATTVYRTVCVDVFSDGVRLTATNGQLFASAWVPRFDLASDPAHAERGDNDAPEWSCIARDLDWRVRDLMTYVRKETKDIDMSVKFSVSTLTEPFRPTLGEELDPKRLLIEIPNMERLVVPVVSAKFPMHDYGADVVVGEGAQMVSIAADVLAKMAKVAVVSKASGVQLVLLDGNAARWSTIGSLRDFPPAGFVKLVAPKEPTEAGAQDDDLDAELAGLAQEALTGAVINVHVKDDGTVIHTLQPGLADDPELADL